MIFVIFCEVLLVLIQVIYLLMSMFLIGKTGQNFELLIKSMAVMTIIGFGPMFIPPQVIAPATVCNHLSPVLHKQLPQSSAHEGRDNIAEDEWAGDEEDSIYEKLDLSRIVAESQKSKDVTSNNLTKQSGCLEGVKPNPLCASSGQGVVKPGQGVVKPGQGVVKQGDVVPIDEVYIQWDDDWDSAADNKCSVAKTTVTLNSSNSGATATGDVTSVTPAQEKWFSHIGSDHQAGIQGGMKTKNRNMCNNGSLSSTGVRTNRQTSVVQTSEYDRGERIPVNNETGGRAHKMQGYGKADTMQYANAKSSTPTHKGAGDNGRPCQTPQSAIGNRLKQRLQNNAKVVMTPVQNRTAQLKKASIEVAMSEAIEVKDQMTDKDVGPFYGLPSKVQELLIVHRGIGKFYGE